MVLLEMFHKWKSKMPEQMEIAPIENETDVRINRAALQDAIDKFDQGANSISDIHKALKELSDHNLKQLNTSSQRLEHLTEQLKKSHDSNAIDLAALEKANLELAESKTLLDTNQTLLDQANKMLAASAENLRKNILALDIANAQALYDPLTKLPNRRLFTDRFDQALHLNQRAKTHIGILFLDLDKFKLVNDCFGHAIGDLLLIEIAHRVKDAIRSTDTLARFGGDEFVVLLNNLDSDDKLAAVELEHIAEKIRKGIDTPVTVERDSKQLIISPQCTASIGFALFAPEHDEQKSLEKMLILTDKAMYQAKKSGGNKIQTLGGVVATSEALCQTRR